MNLGTFGALVGLLLPAGGWPFPFMARELPVAERRRRSDTGRRTRSRRPLVPGLADCIARELRQRNGGPRRARYWGDRRSRVERKGGRP